MPFLLDKIDSPEELKKLKIEELQLLGNEVREFIIDVVSKKGGHLASSLGVVELTLALHYIFDSPKDKFIFDVGHQGYVHKILTGRKKQFMTLREYKGISGFLKMSESDYDCYGAGHASTSISAALGMAVARDMRGGDNKIVSIIGDGAITGGLAFEGLNNAGHSERDILVVLNDNEMSISRNVGAVSHYLTSLTTNLTYKKIKKDIYSVIEKVPNLGETLSDVVRKLEMGMKNVLVPGSLFQALGFHYYGPIDGHDLKELTNILKKLKNAKSPVLLHVITQKGKGYSPAERNPDRFHGVGPFDKNTGEPLSQDGCLQYTNVFGKTIVELAEEDNQFVAITAAMCGGTGLEDFREKYPDRFYDVGIAEGHAVTFAAGLATSGIRPVVAIYSTFLQRAFDPVIHDVAIQNLPVIFVLDRAGLVGADGPTHHGSFDLSYFRLIPNVVISAPKDGNELKDLLYSALKSARSPFAIRYPRDACPAYDQKKKPRVLDIGTWEILREGHGIAILAVGSMVSQALAAAELLKEHDQEVTVVNCRFIKPMDGKVLKEIREKCQLIITVEENSLKGGFGEGVDETLETLRLSLTGVYHLGIPDTFIEHGSRKKLLKSIGLTSEEISDYVLRKLD
jgi:1-deoxy-D-xylulose-5-phosphate synthase